MPGGITGGDIFDFVIMDDGANLMFELTRQSNPADNIVVTATSAFAPVNNLISFHNRESGRRSNLDDVVIESKNAAGARASRGRVTGTRHGLDRYPGYHRHGGTGGRRKMLKAKQG